GPIATRSPSADRAHHAPPTWIPPADGAIHALAFGLAGDPDVTTSTTPAATAARPIPKVIVEMVAERCASSCRVTPAPSQPPPWSHCVPTPPFFWNGRTPKSEPIPTPTAPTPARAIPEAKRGMLRPPASGGGVTGTTCGGGLTGVTGAG